MAASLTLKIYVLVNYLYGSVIDIGLIATVTTHIKTPYVYFLYYIIFSKKMQV